jgi:rSAM/selenodomain-associated transferase 1
VASTRANSPDATARRDEGRALTQDSRLRHERAIAVFAKVPQPGLTKTRLIPVLGAEGAAALQARLIECALATAHAVDGAEVCLWLAGDTSRYAVESQTSWAPQEGNDLGARMAHAFVVTLAHARACVLIGTDCPALEAVHLRRAFDELERSDVVVIPAEDGGYVLIGLKTPQPSLFEDIAWGGPTVMQATRARIDAAVLRAAYLAPLPDLDTPADLARARAAGWLDF